MSPVYRKVFLFILEVTIRVTTAVRCNQVNKSLRECQIVFNDFLFRYKNKYWEHLSMTLSNMEFLDEEIINEAHHKCHIVKLSPFFHQVGGHNVFLKYDENILCKPLDKQEHVVYSHIPEELKCFLPNFYGMSVFFLGRN